MQDLNLVSRIYEIYKLRETKMLQVHKGAETGVWEVSEEFLLTCAKIMDGRNNVRSIETGMGLSTAVFSNFGWSHTAISPSSDESKGLVDWLGAAKLQGSKMPQLINEYSYIELAKSKYSSRSFDFALIDGNHAFPHVFIDYFYISKLVKVGSFLAIDDINLDAPGKLLEYLQQKSYWKIVKETDKWAILKLLEECDVVHEDWDS